MWLNACGSAPRSSTPRGLLPPPNRASLSRPLLYFPKMIVSVYSVAYLGPVSCTKGSALGERAPMGLVPSWGPAWKAAHGTLWAAAQKRGEGLFHRGQRLHLLEEQRSEHSAMKPSPPQTGHLAMHLRLFISPASSHLAFGKFLKPLVTQFLHLSSGAMFISSFLAETVVEMK